MSTLLHKAADPHIDPEKPWENDDFQREEYGKRLTRLVTNTPGSFVIALKAPWGAGKSIFLKRWEAHLELSDIPVAHVDAWRSDYLDDPLAAFVLALKERLDRYGASATRTKARRIGTALLKYGAPLAKSALSAAAASTTNGLSKGVQNAIEAVVAETPSWVNQAIEHRKNSQGFENQLLKAREQLCIVPDDPTAPRSPLVIVVDELDRCRPDFAIKALERIKHYFGVSGIVFVIATDGDNLPSAVRTLYGPRVDGERYLRKFFDYEFRLPLPSHEMVIDWLFKESGLIREICSALDGAEYQRLRQDLAKGSLREKAGDRYVQILSVIEHLRAVCQTAALPVRDCIQASTIAIALIRSAATAEALLPPLLALSVATRFCVPAVFDKIASGTDTIPLLVAHNKSYGQEWQDFVQRMEVLWSQDNFLSKEFKLLLEFRTYGLEERNNRLRVSNTRETVSGTLAAEAAFKQSCALGNSTAERQLGNLLTIVGKSSDKSRG